MTDENVEKIITELFRLRTIVNRCADLADLWEHARPSSDGWTTDEARAWNLAGIDLRQTLGTL